MKASIVASIVVLAAATAAAEPTSKKDRARAEKTTATRPAPRTGVRPARLVNLYNTWTHEWLAVEPGTRPPKDVFDRFLRDHYTGSPSSTGMEPKLLDMLLAAAKHFDRDRVLVVSAFRHPKYNLLLRKKGHQVARDSHHTKGDAVDFHLPRVSVMKLHAWALDQQLGGVGLYRGSGFIHMDTGPVRTWEGE